MSKLLHLLAVSSKWRRTETDVLRLLPKSTHEVKRLHFGPTNKQIMVWRLVSSAYVRFAFLLIYPICLNSQKLDSIVVGAVLADTKYPLQLHYIVLAISGKWVRSRCELSCLHCVLWTFLCIVTDPSVQVINGWKRHKTLHSTLSYRLFLLTSLSEIKRVLKAHR